VTELDALAARIRACTDCALSQTRTHAVPGEGAERPEIMFIGEGPGFHEDQQGRPFVGPAGHYLEQLLASIGMRREQVYIANVVKCRPPNNREPLPGEIAACRKYLDRQIELLNPKLISTLGRFSLAHFFPTEAISRVHGKPRPWNNTTINPLYHPAAALHQGSLRQTIEADFLRIPEVLQGLEQREAQTEAPQPHQLSMF
jgi:DNA polymerase